MGKRELLIALAFIAAGAIAYSVYAPAPNEGQRGLSFSRIWNNIRTSMASNRARATASSTRTIAVPATAHDVRIRGVNGALQVIGEARTDIAAEFTVDSRGPDEATARTSASDTQLKEDSLEDAVVLHVEFPDAGRQTASLVLHVPKRLSLRVDGGTRLTASDLAAVRMSGTSGAGTLQRIAGPIAGDFRGGTLEVTEAGSVDLTLAATQTTLTGVSGESRLDVRAGRCTLKGSGPADIDGRLTTIIVDGNSGPVRIGGTGGRVEISSARAEVRVDMRRAPIVATLRLPVPLTLSTSDETIDLALGSPPGSAAGAVPIHLDAIASEGDIHAGDFGLTPTTSDRDRQLDHVFGAGPRVSLRTVRGDITVRKLETVEIKKGE